MDNEINDLDEARRMISVLQRDLTAKTMAVWFGFGLAFVSICGSLAILFTD